MDSNRFGLPKIAPNVYRRVRVQTWLEFHAGVALRFVNAPAGAGKTTEVVLYARSRSHRVGYIAIKPFTTPSECIVQLADAAGVEPAGDYAAFIDRLATAGRLEIIVDDIDNASSSVSELLQRLYRDVAEAVTCIYFARSTKALFFDGGETQGLVATSNPELFAFATDEIACFAQELGLNEDPMSIARLARGTFGWATAVAGVCLDAAANGWRMRDAQVAWQRRMDPLLTAIVADASRCVPPDVAAEFSRLRRGRAAGEQSVLRMFARYGLFVHEHDGRYTLNPLFALHSNEAVWADRPSAAAAKVEMFGRFAFAIDGQALIWQRRRDRQIIQYLAMQPDGRATRAQLIAVFWPDADPHLAAQSLRTACSTIRRAFAACVGPASVGRYFVAEQYVVLRLDAVVSSVARFQTHIGHGDRAFDIGDARVAFAHYAAAQQLYIAPLLAGEPPTVWSDSWAARLAVMQRRACERLDTLGRCVTSADVGQFRSILAAHELSA